MEWSKKTFLKMFYIILTIIPEILKVNSEKIAILRKIFKGPRVMSRKQKMKFKMDDFQSWQSAAAFCAHNTTKLKVKSHAQLWDVDRKGEKAIHSP